MCNKLHKESVPIPKRGIGWRLERENGTGLFTGILPSLNEFKVQVWRGRNLGYSEDNGEYGFCIFLSKKEAKQCLREVLEGPYGGDWRRYRPRVVRIWYEGGMGKHVDTKVNGLPHEIAIVRVIGPVPVNPNRSLAMEWEAG